MIALRNHYEGSDQKDKRSIVAEAHIGTGQGGLYYRNESSFSFDLYASELQRAYTVLKNERQEYSQITMVKRLLDGIQVTNNSTMQYAKNYCNDKYRDDFVGAVTYISGKVLEAFPPTAGARKRLNTGNYRKISEVKRGGGYHRGGRGGRGGRGRGRSGRGTSNSSASFNGVDCSDVTKEFSSEEWTRMGAQGQAYVRRERNQRNNRGRGRGGRGGRGNPGRTVQEVATETQNDGDTVLSSVTNQTRQDGGNTSAGGGRGGTNGTRFGRGMYQNNNNQG